MSGRKAVEIKRFGLTEVYTPEDESKSVAIIVFVHGLFGHPQRTWTGRKEPERRIPSRSYQSSNNSRQLEHSTGTGRVAVTTDLETELEVSNGTSLRGTSLQGLATPCSSTMAGSQIVGLQPGEVFWPETILPSVLPEARIFTWGYDADVDAFNTSVGHNTVEQHATDLLTDVANLSEKLRDLARPIIFVVHSLGGIVVKEALNIASHSEIERLNSVALATYGISFLGTPHRGSGSATLGKHAYRIARLATKRPNIKLLRSLEKNSDTLKGISNRFRGTQQKWDIKISSFYEDREVRKFFVFHSLIVDNESAQIGHPGEEVSSIPKNHREMTKFTSSEEVGFERVSSQLRRWANEISVSQTTYKPADLEDCLSSLENSQTRTRYINVASSYDGTLQWLFDHDIVSFVDWLEEDQNVPGPSRPIFWINGKPGSGKSTLMKFAMRDERTRELLGQSSCSVENPSAARPEWIMLGFFFHDRGSHIQKSIEGMLQGVLHQLLSQVPNLLPFAYAIYDYLVKAQSKSNSVWTFDSLSAAWVAVTKQRKVPLYACIFLDALDEHEGDNNQLSKFIYELISSADGRIVRLKICVASRTWNIFGEHFGTCPQFAIHEHTAGDIQAYTSERLSAPVINLGDGARITLSPGIERLSSQVTTKAHGVFIWVRIVVDELVKGLRDGTAISLLEEKLSQMPEELSLLYRHTLQRIERDYAEEAYIMLQITLCSISPLPIKTFMNCVSFARWQRIHEVSEEEMVRQLISRSGGLLETIVIRREEQHGGSSTWRDIPPLRRAQSLRSAWEGVRAVPRAPRLVLPGKIGTSGPTYPQDQYDYGNADESQTIIAIQFIHQTVKDFVAEKHNDLGLLLDPTFKVESGYLLLLDCAIRFGNTWAEDLSSPIFEYAFLAETDGLTDASRLYEVFLPMLEEYKFDPKSAALTVFEWVRREVPQYQGILNDWLGEDRLARLLLLTAAADLKCFVTYQVETVQSPRGLLNDPTIQQILLPWIATGIRLSSTSASRESMLKLLLKLGLGTDASCRPLEDDAPLVMDIPRTTLAWVLRQTPQNYISKEEGYSIARFLLESGASPDTLAVPDGCCPDGTSLFYSCIRHYDVEAVRLLLLHEANPPNLDYPQKLNIYIVEKMREETTMSQLLTNYNIETVPGGEDLHSAGTLLVLQSGVPIVIGSPPIGERIIHSHPRTIRL